MPINPSTFAPSEPDPDDQATPAQAQEQEALDAAAVAEEPPKRKRRTKAELIADAVVPADDAMVEIKDAGTGAKVMREWGDALLLVKEGKAEWVDSALKYALMKYEQQQVASAFEQPPTPEQVAAVEGAKDDAPAGSVPPGAAIGDEVRLGSDTYRVGHGNVLTNSPVADPDGNIIQPKRRWQRELGSGLNGPWESTALTQVGEPRPIFDKAETNGDGAPNAPVELVVPEDQEAEIVKVSEFTWKVGTGILEKIGLPDYSSLQIGPISASRMVVDDGRRSTVTIGSRQASIPTSVVEVFQEVSDVVEYIARYQRGELVSFLESTGALKQPVSA